VRNYNRRMSAPADITGLLKAWSRGDKEALEQLMPLVYAQLHAQARRYMRSERADLTLQSTALVHEVYLRLTKAHDVNCNERAHFFALSAQLMRRGPGPPRSGAAVRRRRDARRRTIRTGFRPPSPTVTSCSVRSTTRSTAWRSVIRDK
jgi:hypothetical protein